MKPKKKQLMPIVIGAALVGAYLLFGRDAGAAPAPGPAPAPPPPPPPPAQDHVMQTTGGLMNTRQAQVMLKSLGPAAGDSAMSAVVIDGAYGPQTATAINHYMAIKGLGPQDGQLDGATAQQLATDYNQYISQGGKPAV